MDRLLRTVERLENDQWVKLAGFEDLHEGDTFRLFESDGTPVLWKDEDGKGPHFIARSEPYQTLGDHGMTWGIEADLVDNKG